MLFAANAEANESDNCATIMFAEAEAFPGFKIVKGGTVDDQDELNKHKPGSEIYTRNRRLCPQTPNTLTTTDRLMCKSRTDLVQRDGRRSTG